jgi:copper chaperone
MTTSTYTVVGMTCEHCVRSVSEEVGAIPGVSDLSVDLATGSLSVTTDTEPVADAAVRDAVAEAGYSLAG